MLGRLPLFRKALLGERIELAQRALHRREALRGGDAVASPQQDPEDHAGQRRERGRSQNAERDAPELRGERLG